MILLCLALFKAAKNYNIKKYFQLLFYIQLALINLNLIFLQNREKVVLNFTLL